MYSTIKCKKASLFLRCFYRTHCTLTISRPSLKTHCGLLVTNYTISQGFNNNYYEKVFALVHGSSKELFQFLLPFFSNKKLLYTYYTIKLIKVKNKDRNLPSNYMIMTCFCVSKRCSHNGKYSRNGTIKNCIFYEAYFSPSLSLFLYVMYITLIRTFTISIKMEDREE